MLGKTLTKQYENLEDEVEAKKKEGCSDHLKNRDGKVLKMKKNYINQVIKRASHRTQRFIRWLRTQLYKEAPWSESIRLLKMFWLKKKT